MSIEIPSPTEPLRRTYRPSEPDAAWLGPRDKVFIVAVLCVVAVPWVFGLVHLVLLLRR